MTDEVEDGAQPERKRGAEEAESSAADEQAELEDTLGELPDEELSEEEKSLDGEEPEEALSESVEEDAVQEAARTEEKAPGEEEGDSQEPGEAEGGEGDGTPGKSKRVQPGDVTDELRRQVESLLFATEQPISARKVAAVLKVREPLVRVAIHDLRAQYNREGHAFAVEEIAGGYQVLTRPEYGSIVKNLYEETRKSRLSQAALETLAIVAYKQPIIRVEIEDIRGVAVGDVLRNLMDLGLVRVLGRAEVLGRPMLYGTTQKFLHMFGLKSPKDLPSVEELKKQQL